MQRLAGRYATYLIVRGIGSLATNPVTATPITVARGMLRAGASVRLEGQLATVTLFDTLGRRDPSVYGTFTLGELEGISKESQYQMAKVGFNFLREGKHDQAHGHSVDGRSDHGSNNRDDDDRHHEHGPQAVDLARRPEQDEQKQDETGHRWHSRFD